MHLPAFVKRIEDDTVVQPQAVVLAALQPHVRFLDSRITGHVEPCTMDLEEVRVPAELVCSYMIN